MAMSRVHHSPPFVRSFVRFFLPSGPVLISYNFFLLLFILKIKEGKSRNNNKKTTTTTTTTIGVGAGDGCRSDLFLVVLFSSFFLSLSLELLLYASRRWIHQKCHVTWWPRRRHTHTHAPSFLPSAHPPAFAPRSTKHGQRIDELLFPFLKSNNCSKINGGFFTSLHFTEQSRAAAVHSERGRGSLELLLLLLVFFFFLWRGFTSYWRRGAFHVAPKWIEPCC